MTLRSPITAADAFRTGPKSSDCPRRWAFVWVLAFFLGCRALPEEGAESSSVQLTRVERVRSQALEAGELDAQPPQVELRGRLQLDRLPEASKWMGSGAPLRACIARFPDQPIESTADVGYGWMRQADSRLGVFFGHANRFIVELDVAPDGRFRAQFPAGLLELKPGERSRFAMVFGRPGSDGSLPELRPLPEAFATLELLGESALTELDQIINAVGRPLPGVHDPVALARAVNRLRDEGKRGALDALRSYVDRAETLGYRQLWWRRAEDPADMDAAVVVPIVQLLFQAGPAAPPFPSYRLSSLAAPEDEDDSLYPLRLIDGLPYLLGRWQVSRPGRDASFDPEPFMEWAERYGRIRSRPLAPGNDPLSAIEQLDLDSEQAQRNRLRLQVLLGFGRIAGIEARQALAAEVGLLESPMETGSAFRSLWTRLNERLAQGGLRWDFNRHDFASLQ